MFFPLHLLSPALPGCRIHSLEYVRQIFRRGLQLVCQFIIATVHSLPRRIYPIFS